MQCGNQIRLKKDVETRLRRDAIRFHGKTLEPVRNFDTFVDAVLYATPPDDIAIISELCDIVDAEINRINKEPA